MNTRLKKVARAFVPRPLRTGMKRAAYFGARHRCPLCRSRVRRYDAEGYDFPVLRELEVIGGEHLPEASCPVCHAGSRTRLVWLYLVRASGIFERPTRLLHLAPEPGLYRVLAAAPGLDYVVGDLDPARYPFAREIRPLDLTRLPYPDASFDAILANHILEHIEDDHRAMAEIRRVLRPDGFALVQVPIAPTLARTREDPNATTPEQRERAYGQRDHVRLYGADYPERLRRAGLAVEPWVASEHGGDDIAPLRLNPRERLFVVRPAAPVA